MPALLALTLVLAACGAPLAPANVPAPVATFTPAPPTATPDPTIPRLITLEETEGTVETRLTAEEEFKIATRGAELPPKAEVRTGADGKSLLKITPEGTALRLGPNSHLAIQDLTPSAADAQTRLQLFLGKIYIVLNGGSLDVDTPSGLATVRGSMMSLTYDPDLGDLTVTCLEGHCRVGNEFGETDLFAGEATNVPGAGQPPNPPRPISPEELDEWKQEVPESQRAFDALAQPPGPPQVASQLAPGQPLPDVQPPGQDALYNEPVTYSLTNLCWGVWHWEFRGPVDVNIDVAPDTTETGELPPGIYEVRDWDDSGFDNGWYETGGGTNLIITHDCPDPQSAPPGP